VLELEQLYDANLALANQLLLNNVGLVHSEARRIHAVQGGNFTDLVRWGMTGLQDGIYRYAPGYCNRAGQVGVKTALTSVAVGWIGHHIRRSLQHHGHTIALPVTMQELRSIAGRVASDTKKTDPWELAEEILLRRRAKRNSEFAAKLQADANAVLAELRKTEQWREEVCVLANHVAVAVSLPTTQPVGFDFDNAFQMQAIENGRCKHAAPSPLAATDAFCPAGKEHAIGRVFEVMKGLHPNGTIALSLSFGLSNAREAGRDFLRGIIAESHARTDGIDQQRLQREREKAGDGAVARVILVDGMDTPEANNE